MVNKDFLHFLASTMNHILIITNVTINHAKIRKIYKFFVKKIKSKRIVIRLSLGHKIILALMIFIVTYSIYAQMGRYVMLILRVPFVVLVYTCSMHYIICVMLI